MAGIIKKIKLLFALLLAINNDTSNQMSILQFDEGALVECNPT